MTEFVNLNLLAAGKLVSDSIFLTKNETLDYEIIRWLTNEITLLRQPLLRLSITPMEKHI